MDTQQTFEVLYTQVIVPVSDEISMDEPAIQQGVRQSVEHTIRRDYLIQHPGTELIHLKVTELHEKYYQSSYDFIRGTPLQRYIIAKVEYAVAPLTP